MTNVVWGKLSCMFVWYQRTNLTATVDGTAVGKPTIPSFKLFRSGLTVRVSLAASSRSFCTFACLFLQINERDKTWVKIASEMFFFSFFYQIQRKFLSRSLNLVWKHFPLTSISFVSIKPGRIDFLRILYFRLPTRARPGVIRHA